MSTKLVLLNPTIILGSPKAVQAGSILDSVTNSLDITALVAAGGIMVPQGTGLVSSQQAIAISKKVNKGANEVELALTMLAAGLSTPDPIQVQQAAITGTQAEAQLVSLGGAGLITGIYYQTATATALTAGNKYVVVFNLYDNTGTLVGALATGTIGDGVAGQQTVKWVRFSFGALANNIFGDGYTVTATATLTGAGTLPLGMFVVLTKPTYN